MHALRFVFSFYRLRIWLRENPRTVSRLQHCARFLYYAGYAVSLFTNLRLYVPPAEICGRFRALPL